MGKNGGARSGDLTGRDWLDAGLEFAGGVRDVAVAAVTGQPPPQAAQPAVPSWDQYQGRPQYSGQQQVPVASPMDDMLPVLIGIGALGLIAVLAGRK